MGRGALFGPTAAVLAKSLGTAPGAALAAIVMVLQTAVPLAVAARAFRRRDW